MRDAFATLPSWARLPLGRWAVVLPVRLLTDGVRGQLDRLEEVL